MVTIATGTNGQNSRTRIVLVNCVLAGWFIIELAAAAYFIVLAVTKA